MNSTLITKEMAKLRRFITIHPMFMEMLHLQYNSGASSSKGKRFN
jgi:hypothetical protein